ncbi:hypothetical protein F5884DRAFT_824061 [Xylogone sp. PMI_703]|nr:hypothetical protein F5884DRAFT_824061 [Xylogone sp. PMI_703]
MYSSKAILNDFPKPTTLTLFQFSLVATLCFFMSGLSFYPTRSIIITTMPLAGFQIIHTIKGLSPLFTVFAYRFIFNIRYPVTTYISLIPLILGVALACVGELNGNLFGIIYAFLSALVFRLFMKRAIIEGTNPPELKKLDKLNLLCYSSDLAFLLIFPF